MRDITWDDWDKQLFCRVCEKLLIKTHDKDYNIYLKCCDIETLENQQKFGWLNLEKTSNLHRFTNGKIGLIGELEFINRYAGIKE